MSKPRSEYELYLPVGDENIQSPKIICIKNELIKVFGGVTETKYRNKGVWLYGKVKMTDAVNIWRFLGPKTKANESAIKRAQRLLKKAFEQKAILVVKRRVFFV